MCNGAILLTINFDDCFVVNVGGTNKNQYVINGFCVESVRIYRFNTCSLEFLRLGHTKNPGDQVFASYSITMQNEDIFNH